jgi:peptidoglycan/LPS O-acetylase OafA/YrhL
LRAAAIGLVIVDHALDTWGALTFLAPLRHAGNLARGCVLRDFRLDHETLLLRELDARREVSLKNFYARRFFRSRARCASQDHVVEVT